MYRFTRWRVACLVQTLRLTKPAGSLHAAEHRISPPRPCVVCAACIVLPRLYTDTYTRYLWCTPCLPRLYGKGITTRAQQSTHNTQQHFDGGRAAGCSRVSRLALVSRSRSTNCPQKSKQSGYILINIENMVHAALRTYSVEHIEDISGMRPVCMRFSQDISGWLRSGKLRS